MKKALVEYNGMVKEVVDPGEEYPIYSGEGATMQWVDAPDDVTIFWTLDIAQSKVNQFGLKEIFLMQIQY
jgi:hypothetical protein